MGEVQEPPAPRTTHKPLFAAQIGVFFCSKVGNNRATGNIWATIMKVFLTLSSRVLKDGTQPIQLEGRAQGRRYRVRTGISCLAHEWDVDAARLRGRSQEVRLHNMRLQQLTARATQVLLRAELQGRSLSSDQFSRDLLQTSSLECFLTYCEDRVEQDYTRRMFSEATMAYHQRALRKLREFAPEGLQFNELSRARLEKFDAWHAKQLEAAGSDGLAERQRVMMIVRKYLTRAAEDGYEFEDPMQGFSVRKPKPRMVYLTYPELKRIIRLYLEPDHLRARMEAYGTAQGWRSFDVERYVNEQHGRLREYIRAFLGQCHSGIRYSDLVRVTRANVVGDALVYQPKKTRETSGKEVRLPISPDLRLFMDMEAKTLFPQFSNQKYNKQLKIIAQLARIEKSLTTHVGRHTFASLSVAAGVSLVSLKELLGVTDLKTVAVYAHSSYEQQKREVERAWSRL